MNNIRNEVITTKLKGNEVCKMRQILIGGAWPYANGSDISQDYYREMYWQDIIEK